MGVFQLEILNVMLLIIYTEAWIFVSLYVVFSHNNDRFQKYSHQKLS